ncbi:MAG: peptidase domain-containing ABC transporter [Leptolyngbyaceae cyanobacterium bins.349]|nr:peptidase domain-containing ABC transporter [Leptolyngbyaceae cyanobacterium bins.349]
MNTMTGSTHTGNTQEFLGSISPFRSLSPEALTRLVASTQLLRYRMGQPIIIKEKMPAHVSVLFQGQARLLGYDPNSQLPSTLQRLESGAILGWVSLLRGVACETAIASTEAVCITIPAITFLKLLEQEPQFAAHFAEQPALVEVFDLLAMGLKERADSDRVLAHADVTDLRQFALKVWTQATVVNVNGDGPQGHGLDGDRLWLISGGRPVTDLPVGQPYNPNQATLQPTQGMTRLVGVDKQLLLPPSTPQPQIPSAIPAAAALAPDIPFAPDYPAEADYLDNGPKKQYPHVSGKGQVDAVLACFQMLAQHLAMPFRRDSIRKVLVNQYDRMGALSLMTCGAVAELMNLSAQLVTVPAASVGRLQAPAIVAWNDSFAVLYEISERNMVLGVPQTGIQRLKTSEFTQVWGEQGQVLLLQPTQYTPQQKFGLNWFLPYLYKYRRVLIEVLIASFFVQLFGLANPLMTQVIIDKVLVQNSADTLQVLGIFLIVIALFEALLTSLRTFLFVDTTNRIDLALGTEIINHLLRLPLRYFERRPVGELSTRINELENIRQFMTTTALTVVLDAVFSVIYIVVMIFYSWQLTLVALATIPLFALLTALVSPIVRRQLRVKAERNAETQSYLVEVLSGIQTVKAQNIELRSRWKWQERYARYVSAGFKTVQTVTAASSTSQFLNQLSSLLVLWVGAYLVLQGELTLGQLIAFRIIAGYVTSPLLRLTQLWQNFQETALSLERLADIVDTPMESDESDRTNISMPLIQGSVKFENVSFRFNPSGPLQLSNINVEFPAGVFVGIVGQSGSGKSTMMKLLPRLYPLESGRILIDAYDINKVELYSLRRQIGIVPQDTLLFEGTIQDNISLNYPEATNEEIIDAAKVAAAHDFIMNLPNGYNTQVGERGASLSGGQRQRVAIARTVLQNPNLLILDEATSALDYESERQVCLNLAEAFRGRTVFFITHRLSTIRNADVILMMDQGVIVEQGTHEELMEMKGRYYCLFRQQEAASV